MNLACATGLESAQFDEGRDLPAYLNEALAFIHDPRNPTRREWPSFFDGAVERIRALQSLYSEQEPPEQLVEAIRTITDELLKYLKRHPEAMYEMRPRQFEELIAEVLASYGWDVQLTPESKDGGYDIYAISKDVSGVQSAWLIECKRYREDRKVGVDIARSLFGVKGQLNVANAMLATTSHFTRGVHELKASRYDLELRDYEGILEWINEYRPNPNGKLYLKDNTLVLPGQES